MKIRTKAPNFALTKELNENTNKSTKFWLNVWQDWALAREYDVDIEKYVEVRIQFCHANNKLTSNHAMLLVQLGNSTRDVWKFAKLDSLRRLVQFWQNFQTSLVLLISNCIRHRMITYTYTGSCQINWFG
jgi:hypothetical protein